MGRKLSHLAEPFVAYKPDVRKQQAAAQKAVGDTDEVGVVAYKRRGITTIEAMGYTAITTTGYLDECVENAKRDGVTIDRQLLERVAKLVPYSETRIDIDLHEQKPGQVPVQFIKNGCRVLGTVEEIADQISCKVGRIKRLIRDCYKYDIIINRRYGSFDFNPICVHRGSREDQRALIEYLPIEKDQELVRGYEDSIKPPTVPPITDREMGHVFERMRKLEQMMTASDRNRDKANRRAERAERKLKAQKRLIQELQRNYEQAQRTLSNIVTMIQRGESAEACVAAMSDLSIDIGSHNAKQDAQ